MKRFLSLHPLLTVLLLGMFGGGLLLAADNFSQSGTRTTGTSDVAILRATDNSGVQTPHVIVAGTASITTAQRTLSTSASVVLAADNGRHSALIRNLDTTISIYVGATGVTSTTGMLLKAGESITITSKAALYAVAASGTPVAATLAEND